MKPFKMVKFATMLKNSPNMSGGLITTRKDKRVTKTGKILRISKLNELPQLFNVLFGQMSFVGPRPLVQSSIELYPPQTSQNIYKSKPGITGIGSIVFRDEEKMVTESTLPPLEFYKQKIFPHKAQLELWYQQNASFLTDLKILLLTALVILFPKTQLWKKWFKTLPELRN